MKTINGQKFKMLVISGANNLYNHYPEIDALNVFPVPDGDTGMNMNLTLSSGSTEIQNRTDTSIGQIAKAFSRGLLMGARGNSGVITSQIFRGIASGLEALEEATSIQLAEAFENGRKIAYKAVIKPVEGTILTVIRESASTMLEKVNERTSIEDALKILLNEAKESLARTPNLLPVLKEVGVVDSGGAGLVRIIEGMYLASKGEFIRKNEASALVGLEEDEDKLSYTMNFKLALLNDGSKELYQEIRFNSFLEQQGANLSLTRSGNLIEVQLNTENPGTILTFAQKYGEFIDVSIKNLKETELKKSTAKIEIIDESLNEKDDKDSQEDFVCENEYALIATSSGKGVDDLFRSVGVEYIVSGGQTMNPSTEDFLKLIKEAKSKVCYIFPNNSNIIMAAEQAREIMKDKVDVMVIPSKTIMQGVVAAMSFIPELGAEENLSNMTDALETVKSGCVTFSIKDSDINGLHINKGEFMAIKETKDILSSHISKLDALRSLLKTIVDKDSAIITLLLGEDITKEEEEEVNNFLNSRYSNLDLDIKRGDQPVYSFIVGVE